MGPENVSDAVAGRRVSRRASHACAKCQKRKVRCDVAIRGSPCVNCYLDGQKCELPKRSRRVRGRAHAQGIAAQRPSAKPHRMPSLGHENIDEDKEIESHNSKEDGPGGNLGGGAGDIWTMELSNNTASPGAADKRADSQQVDVIPGDRPDLFSRIPSQTLADHGLGNQEVIIANTMSKHAEGHTAGPEETKTEVCQLHAASLSNYIGYSYYQFLALNNVGSIPIQDYQFLELQGCLHVPVCSILDIFVEQYFLHMHPILPILDEGMFWDIYSQNVNVRERGRKLSLLVFQAMLFACCNFVPQTTLSQLGLHTKRKARAVTYRRAKLLFDLEAETSSISKSQAALLLASWSFSFYEVPRKPNTPWLSIAIQYARASEAHKYQTYSADSASYAVRKRLWWCCIIRDRLFSLGMRRGIQITAAQFDVTHSLQLGYRDLASEIHRSKVHDCVTKIKLAEVLEFLVGLCVILTDILELAYPIADCVNNAHDKHEILRRLRSSQMSLQNWHEKAAKHLPRSVRSLEKAVDHDSVILYGNLVYMYYYSTKISLGHYEILQVATTAMPSSAAWDNIFVRKIDHIDLQNAALEMAGCLERLSRSSLIGWLPVTAVSCTALPFLLHILGTDPSSSKYVKESVYSSLIKDRLQVLRTAMETYQFQYEGVNWIIEVINRVASLSRTASISPAGASVIGPNEQSSTAGEGRMGKLIFQPSWYLRLAFAVDVALSKGRLPADESFSRSFQELVLSEAGQYRDVSRRVWDGDKSSDSLYCATRGTKNNQSIAAYAEASPEDTRLRTEPSYVITEMKDPSWERLLFSNQEGRETEMEINGGVDSGTMPPLSEDNMTCNTEENPGRDLDIFSFFAQEDLDGSADFPAGLLPPTY